jgi:hypothetical protein
MNQAHLHLLANHFPIIIPVVGLLVMIGGFIFRSEMVKRTSFAIFILGAICTIPAFFTGEGAEEVHLIVFTRRFSATRFMVELETKIFFGYYFFVNHHFCRYRFVFCEANRNNWRRNQAHRN